ncbi:MAG: hypothetical protein ACK4GN_03610 [Runella sp.]
MQFIRLLTQWYDHAEHQWHSLRVSRAISNVVLLFFLIGAVVSLLSYWRVLPFQVSRYFAIELAFSVLLLAEIMSLVFIFTHSVADSISKQFEIVSLILLRDSFKELGHLPIQIEWQPSTLIELLPLLIDALGAVIIFLVSVVFDRMQKHTKITTNAEDQSKFVIFKKFIALILLVLFVSLGLADIWGFVQYHQFKSSFNLYFTLLIFTDILVLIVSLRYSNNYLHLFRYSAFALTTVLLRLSLSAPKYYNVLISVTAGVFVLLVAFTYNQLNRPTSKSKLFN